MSSLILDIAVIVLLLVMNGVFSMSEMAMVAARKVRLQHLADDGDKGARAALEIATHPTNFLSTVQVGITLIGVLAGAFGGAGLSSRIANGLRNFSWIAPYAEPVALALVVASITYLSLIIGELVPKQLALGQPERISAVVARPMRALSRIGAPVVALLTNSTTLVLRLFGIRANVETGITEQDIRSIVEQGAESGALQPAEHQIVENTFRLGDRQVQTIMTPRVDLSWVTTASSRAEVLAELDAQGRARGFPLLVCADDIENVVGIVYPDDLLHQCLSGNPLDLAAVQVEPLFIPDSMPVLKLLELFRRARRQSAVVLDEYGGVAGVVTLDDILEALVGEMPEHGSTDDPEMVRRPDGSWLVDGMTAIDDLESVVDLDPNTADARHQVATVAGLVMFVLGHLPQPGDEVDHSGVRFRVETMDGRRINRVSVHQLPSRHADR